jgi:hypothetical protein
MAGKSTTPNKDDTYRLKIKKETKVKTELRGRQKHREKVIECFR